MDSCTDCLAVEIWTIILDLVIHIPHLLDTSCTKESFFEFLGSIVEIYRPLQDWRASEKQRCLLAHVCRSWKKWADIRKDRYIQAQQSGVPHKTISHAERVPLLSAANRALDIRHD